MIAAACSPPGGRARSAGTRPSRCGPWPGVRSSTTRCDAAVGSGLRPVRGRRRPPGRGGRGGLAGRGRGRRVAGLAPRASREPRGAPRGAGAPPGGRGRVRRSGRPAAGGRGRLSAGRGRLRWRGTPSRWRRTTVPAGTRCCSARALWPEVGRCVGDEGARALLAAPSVRGGGLRRHRRPRRRGHTRRPGAVAREMESPVRSKTPSGSSRPIEQTWRVLHGHRAHRPVAARRAAAGDRG